MPSKALHVDRIGWPILSLQFANSCCQRILPLYPGKVLTQSGVDSCRESTFDIAKSCDQVWVEGEGLANLGPSSSPGYSSPGDLLGRLSLSRVACRLGNRGRGRHSSFSSSPGLH